MDCRKCVSAVWNSKTRHARVCCVLCQHQSNLFRAASRNAVSISVIPRLHWAVLSTKVPWKTIQNQHRQLLRLRLQLMQKSIISRNVINNSITSHSPNFNSPLGLDELKAALRSFRFATDLSHITRMICYYSLTVAPQTKRPPPDPEMKRSSLRHPLMYYLLSKCFSDLKQLRKNKT